MQTPGAREERVEVSTEVQLRYSIDQVGLNRTKLNIIGERQESAIHHLLVKVFFTEQMSKCLLIILL